MLKLTLTLLQVFIGIYWTGDIARRNKKVDSLFTALEGKYAILNSRIKDSKIEAGVKWLGALYGWIALCMAFLFLFFYVIGKVNLPLKIALSGVFLISLWSWFSIVWCTAHREVVATYASTFALMVSAPLVLAISDSLFGTSLIQILAVPFHNIPDFLGWGIPKIENPYAIGAICSAIFAASLLIQYFLFWA